MVLADLPSSPGEQVAHDLGPEVRSAATAVTDEASVARALDVAADLGPVRVAVCCPGIRPPGRVLGGLCG